jgi:hypothetical protein
MGSFLTVADLQHSQWQANRPCLFRGRAGAEIGGEIIDQRRGAAGRGEHRQAAGAITQDLIRGPSYNGSLVVSATENTHAATAPTCDFCFSYDRARSLRLHLHAETVKKITHEKPEGSSFRRTSARLFRSRRRKGQPLDGQRRTGRKRS